MRTIPGVSQSPGTAQAALAAGHADARPLLHSLPQLPLQLLPLLAVDVNPVLLLDEADVLLQGALAQAPGHAGQAGGQGLA